MDYVAPYDSLAGFIIGRSLDVVSHQRSIYSVFDFLGDIGGLGEILQLIGSGITAILLTISNISIDKKLVNLIFKHEHELTNQSNLVNNKNISRKSKFTCWQERKLFKAANSQISKELDIVTFIRK